MHKRKIVCHSKFQLPVSINDHAQSRFCICMVNSEYATAGLCYTQPLNNNLFTACEYYFETNPFCHASSTKDFENLAEFNLLQYFHLCTQNSVCATNIGPFGELPFSKNSFRNTIRVSNSLDPDQDRHFVYPDLGPNCLQRISADDKSLLM